MYYNDPRDSAGWSKPYIFLAGLIIGVVLGWIFQGIIGTLVRLALVALVVIAALYFFNLWRKSQQPDRRNDDISDADWRDLNSRHRR